ncbi:uncharacterized protein Dyak_GE19504 [Drosophila yakuba]|uniref:Phosphatidic acid phosphatase type 2/haloperoxidase domain-containing protein n=1 Tax=Drosophila yakuba TaxID=7245 RepID=B4PIM1_DROYA|nr:uncharacterized protein Dyak_GE19504 [Drosophila yakuba]
MSKYSKLARGICDLLIWAALSVACVLLHKMGRPFRRGFFCGDESLSYPNRDDTIGSKVIIAIVLGVPTAVIAVVELFRQLPGGPLREAEGKRHSCRIAHRLGVLYRQAMFYLYGLSMVTFTTMLTKLCIGRLRPHFFAVCQPMLPNGSGCQDAQNLGRYIDSFTCSNANMTDYQFKHDVLAGRTLGVVFAWLTSAYVADLFAGKRWPKAGYSANTLRKPQVSPKSSTKSQAGGSTSGAGQPPSLPAYTFGTLPYLAAHPAQAQAQYAQPYHNYGYVP